MESVITTKSKIQISELAKEITAIAIRWLCMALFFYTAHAKTVDHDRFLKGLARVHLISGFALFLSYAVPIVEFLVALLLLVPNTAKTGLYCFIAVMSAFTIYIASALIWEPTLPCHCGGAIEKLSWGQHIWFNLAFILIAITGVWLINFNKTFKLQKS
ncbi:MauE/DoxX family redox-associated membrane protein [Mucilaginibacter paludis]|uniref:Methylamine utilisation protein MauE domain-containing protein n=1 Tax=Mucilaginibacter paludis DSM 18603 TaxID=714943 RepID=H1YI10_9SPHI|nr:MauE/DoxX family redox-associated membrane protein [Mucilaginibacter paludis]EHQ25558.1 hypothetical protein Mucpa_1398 [Mucilaginibacter paludis DSM 18603]